MCETPMDFVATDRKALGDAASGDGVRTSIAQGKPLNTLKVRSGVRAKLGSSQLGLRRRLAARGRTVLACNFSAGSVAKHLKAPYYFAC